MAVAEDVTALAPAAAAEGGLQRRIGWTGAFWIASGVPALVLFSIGSIGAKVGGPSWAVWIVSILFGLVQSFSYAEIAGLFPHKSGGASVYGAIAWVRYSKLFAPLSVWCNWLAWSPVLALGTSLAAANILNTLFGPGAPIMAWHITLAHLDVIKPGLSLRVDAVFVIGAAILLAAFAIQHRGILGTARMQIILGLVALTPLLIIGVTPFFTGGVDPRNLTQLHPLALGAHGEVLAGRWDRAGVTLVAGGLFIAAWSTYGFETAVCYTREFRDPRRDTVRAILYSGLLCVFVFTVVPLSFEGVLGLGHLVTPAVTDARGAVTTPAVYSGILAPDINDGTGVAKAMAGMLHAGAVVEKIIVAMLVLAMLLAVITSMAGSSRTLYQASVDGWLPRYLSHTNAAGAPVSAMWTDLGFNLLILLLSDSVFVLAISNVCYILFNFLNLNAAWIHRRDRPNWERPFRAPNWLLAAGTVLAFVNLALLGMGADTWGSGTLIAGLVVAAGILPVFLYRHYVTDKGVFPPSMTEDVGLGHAEEGARRSGLLPFLTVLAGVAVVIVTRLIAVY
jgi:amino acid transporter